MIMIEYYISNKFYVKGKLKIITNHIADKAARKTAWPIVIIIDIGLTNSKRILVFDGAGGGACEGRVEEEKTQNKAVLD